MTVQRFFSNPTHSEMPAQADIVIIGGGPAGTAALWALSRQLPDANLVLIEQSGQLAAGASNASLENYRTCWLAPSLARLMRRSIDVFHRADEFFGEGSHVLLGMKQQGYLFCGFNDEQSAILRREVAHLHQMGMAHVEFLDADEIGYRFPWLRDSVIAAKFDPIAGWLDSHALIYRFANSALNAKILLDIKHVEILVELNRVRGVKTPNGSIAAPCVLIAAGANARTVGRTAGIEIPIVVRPRQSFTTPWRHDAFLENSPCIISAAPFPHVRPEARSGAVFGWEYHWNTRQVNGNASPVKDHLIEPIYPAESLKDPRFPSLVLALMSRQFGHKANQGFADPRYLRGLHHRVGYYVYRAPSHAYYVDGNGNQHPYHSQRAIIDTWDGIDGLVLSVAHVGHGIMSAPAVGEIAASKILGHPLPEAVFAEFGLNVNWVENDSGGLSKN